MKTVDYFRVAIKHLNFCEKILKAAVDEDKNYLIEIYYMLGYVFEGFAIYIAYKLEYGNDEKKICWDESNDVEDFFDIEFSSASHLAYYGKKHYENELNQNLKDARKKGCLDLLQGPDYYINKKYLWSDVSQISSQNGTADVDEKEIKKKLDDVELRFCVKNHSFNQKANLVDKCVRPKFEGYVSEKGSLPYFGNPPNFKNEEEHKEYDELMELIREWKTSLRYNCEDDNHLKKIKEKINVKNLCKLTEYCKKIFELIPS